MTILRIFLGVAFSLSFARSDDQERVYSVCELLAKPQQFNGRIVNVRGPVEGGMEGVWIDGTSCDEPFRVGEHTLPSAISLSYQSEFGNAPRRNMAHIARIDQEVREQRRKRSGRLILTYTGVFETRTDWKVVTFGSGEMRLWGFGHLNAFPAQLVIIDKRAPLIEPAPRRAK